MTKYHKKKSKFLIFFSFALTFVLTLSIADFCSNLITLKTFSNTTISNGQNAYSIFAVALGTATSRTTALEQASVLQKQSAAGFVWQENDKFFVVASAYAEENDAILVKGNLEKEGLTPQIVEIKIDALTFSGNYSSSEMNTLVGGVTIFKTVFDNLYDISVALDTKVNTQAQSILFVADVENLASKTKLNFDALFENSTATEIVYIKLSLSKLCGFLDELKNFDTGSTNQTLSSKIKHTYMQCIELNYNLCANI